MPRKLNIAEQVINSRAGGKVERCHIIPHAGSYSNAAHQWGCAMLLHYIFPEDFEALVIYALTHDVPEAWVGDIPGTVTRYLPGHTEAMTQIESAIYAWLNLPDPAGLSEHDAIIIKAVDRLELWLWSLEQAAIGNEYAKELLSEIERVMGEVLLPWGAQLFVQQVRELGNGVRPQMAGVIKELCSE